MTPLAHRILANQLKPVKDRLPVDDEYGLFKDIQSVVCFDVEPIIELITWQAKKMAAVKTPWPTMFLPAPRTWLELGDTGGDGRVAILVEQDEKYGDKWAISTAIEINGGFRITYSGFYNPRILGRQFPTMLMGGGEADDLEKSVIVMLLLAAINAPKVFARVEHNPHAGLARKLAASKAMPGKYPLHAWHEIKLEGWMPKVEHGKRRAKGATGEKAQHFVRAHPRFQNGKWVIVKWHRRGNPQLGMRRARYSVQMPNMTP